MNASKLACVQKVHASACATLAFNAAMLLSCAPPPAAHQDGVFNPWT